MVIAVHLVRAISAGLLTAAILVNPARAQSGPMASQPGQAAAQSGPATAQPAASSISLMSAVMPSADLKRSSDFYAAGLGLVAARGANPRELVLTFPGGGTRLMLLQAAEGTAAARRGPGRVILQVADLKALSTRLKNAGFTADMPIRENAQYRISIAEIEDPDGNSIELIQRGGR